MAIVTGSGGDDFIHRPTDGLTPPPGSNDIPETTAGADVITGGEGDDTIFGGGGDDVANIDVSNDGADVIDLGNGADVVAVGATTETQVRLSFTSAEVGNGSVNDGGALTNQDGGLAVRMQAENGSDGLTGPISRVEDEGVTFVAGEGVTFDVRDLVSGAARGDQFEVVTLGTFRDDTLGALQADRPYYINGGAGNDTITDGTANDFLVGGAGNDTLTAGLGNDSFIGGGGDDSVTGGAGSDTAIHNITTDGADQIDLGADSDAVTVNATAPLPTEVRLTFTSAEVGDGSAVDSGQLANQDGGLAVRMQAENGSDGLTGPVTRVDDESVTFVGGSGVTFDVRDLVSGAARGNEFEVVTLGSSAGDTLGAVEADRNYYINGGQGNDTITDGTGDDFLVGGAGNDTLTATGGDDSFIGGGGDDVISGGRNADVAIHNITTDGADQVDLGLGDDTVTVNATAPTEVRLTFTSAEVGDNSANDGGSLANQDGGLAVRMQAENGSDGLTGPVTRVDDEGTTFEAGAGVTFDVRDLVAGTQRGNEFEVVRLGTDRNDNFTALDDRNYYVNSGAGNDRTTGGVGDDFLVGGAGADRLRGSLGDDSFIGGDGNDTIDGGSGDDLMTGGLGLDVFQFNTALGPNNLGTVTDFTIGDDKFELDNLVFQRIADGGDLKNEAFTRGTEATERSDRIIYDAETGDLFYDRDGSRTGFEAVKFASVTPGSDLSASDFLIV